MNSTCETTDLLVFSQLRWDFVFHRPQHLMSRFARHRRVFYIEAPIFGMTEVPRLHFRETSEGVQVIVPYLPPDIKPELVDISMRDLINDLVLEVGTSHYTLLFCGPMALPYARHLTPTSIIYDCSDMEPQGDDELMETADLVFTSSHMLYEARKHAHHNIHSIPNCIDYEHFSQARLPLVEPEDQANIPRPRIGFYGDIGESLDTQLLEEMAEKMPEYQFILLGPIKETTTPLPQRHNIFYLNDKEHYELPLYFSGWDCAILPVTGSTGDLRISEFLAAGKPVVVTRNQHVLGTYLKKGLVHVASSGSEFLTCIERAIKERSEDPDWLNRVDSFLSSNSWDSIFARMAALESDLKREKIVRPVCPLIESL